MGVAYYIVPERKPPRFDYFVNGKALAHVPEETLNRICAELGVPTFEDFFSQDAEELKELFEEEGIELPEEGLPAVKWFKASDGLKTVRALLRHLQSNPKAVRNCADVLCDLQEFEDVLSRLAKAKIRWHLAIGG
jgi:hypothetical protein